MVGRIAGVEKSTEKHIYKELKLINIETGKELVAVGPILNIMIGECVELTGVWVNNIFKFTSAKRTSSCKEEEAKRLLELNLSLSKEQALAVAELILKSDYDKDLSESLLEIPGIGQVKAEKLNRLLTIEWTKEKLLGLLTRHHAKEDVIVKCFSDKEITPQMILDNPYLLIDFGERFEVCDNISRSSGFKAFSDNRIHGAIKCTMIKAESSGSTKIRGDSLREMISKISKKENSEDEIPHSLSQIYSESDEMLTINQDLSFSFAKTSENETKIAENMLRLRNARLESDINTEAYIRQAEKKLGVTFTVEQRDTFTLLHNGGVKLLTGGPGTGKTLTIAGIVHAYMAYHPEGRVLLCAPTGRAAARMKELAGGGAVASTMHKALGLSHFMKGKPDPLKYDLIICDEMSMTDTEIMAMFLGVVPSKTLLLLAGDYNQLPSVGAGRVFRDIIESNVFDVARLTKVARQKTGSTIPENAHRILSGMQPITSSDFEVLYFRNDEDIEKTTNKLTYRNDTMTLCPLRRGRYGSETIAKKIQSTRTFTSKPIVIRFDTFHNGDIVLMTKNNYDKGYINGDIGEIKSISQTECKIQIMDKLITLKNEDYTDMALAYCMTVHKSQGSECDNVDLILPEAAGNLLSTREILYTAVTRAKKRVRIFTTRKAMNATIGNEITSKRFCGLKEKIQKLT